MDRSVKPKSNSTQKSESLSDIIGKVKPVISRPQVRPIFQNKPHRPQHSLAARTGGDVNKGGINYTKRPLTAPVRKPTSQRQLPAITPRARTAEEVGRALINQRVTKKNAECLLYRMREELGKGLFKKGDCLYGSRPCDGPPPNTPDHPGASPADSATELSDDQADNYVLPSGKIINGINPMEKFVINTGKTFPMIEAKGELKRTVPSRVPKNRNSQVQNVDSYMPTNSSIIRSAAFPLYSARRERVVRQLCQNSVPGIEYQLTPGGQMRAVGKFRRRAVHHNKQAEDLCDFARDVKVGAVNVRKNTAIRNNNRSKSSHAGAVVGNASFDKSKGRINGLSRSTTSIPRVHPDKTKPGKCSTLSKPQSPTTININGNGSVIENTQTQNGSPELGSNGASDLIYYWAYQYLLQDGVGDDVLENPLKNADKLNYKHSTAEPQKEPSGTVENKNTQLSRKKYCNSKVRSSLSRQDLLFNYRDYHHPTVTVHPCPDHQLRLALQQSPELFNARYLDYLAQCAEVTKNGGQSSIRSLDNTTKEYNTRVRSGLNATAQQTAVQLDRDKSSLGAAVQFPLSAREKEYLKEIASRFTNIEKPEVFLDVLQKLTALRGGNLNKATSTTEVSLKQQCESTAPVELYAPDGIATKPTKPPLQNKDEIKLRKQLLESKSRPNKKGQTNVRLEKPSSTGYSKRHNDFC